MLNLSSKEEAKSAKQVPRSLPISPASQKKLLQYPFSWEGFAEPHVWAQLSFRAGAFTDMRHSWFYFCLQNYYLCFNLHNLPVEFLAPFPSQQQLNWCYWIWVCSHTKHCLCPGCVCNVQEITSSYRQRNAYVTNVLVLLPIQNINSKRWKTA